MSFGYSVGDFVAVGVFAYKLYSKCCNSVDEFKSISGEVRGLHIVLEAVADHWKSNELLPKHRQNLEILTGSTLDTLQELEVVLSSHDSLQMGKKLDVKRLTWAAKNLSPIRGKLINSATLLAMFHDTMTATTNSAILRSLSILMMDFHTGKREAAAFSQLSRLSIQNDEEDTWSVVTEELLIGGADKTSISTQRDLIKTWIDDVCILDVTEEKAESMDDSSSNDPNDEGLNHDSDRESDQLSPGPLSNPAEESFPPAPHALNRWRARSSEWEGLTTFWVRRLQDNTQDLQGSPLQEVMSNQIRDLSAAGANLFHAVVELERLRRSTERKIKHWFFEVREEQEKYQEIIAKLEGDLKDERQRRSAATKLLLNE